MSHLATYEQSLKPRRYQKGPPRIRYRIDYPRGNPAGYRIELVVKNPVFLNVFVCQQADYLWWLKSKRVMIMRGHYQHPSLAPMYGYAGSEEFSKARAAWNTAVDEELTRSALDKLAQAL